jgi:cyclopropane fatty-acyl-phospholipid synthase-like methyltransferase
MVNNNWINKVKDYKAFVGNKDHYDMIGQIVFNFLLEEGLKPDNNILDIGCGSLRVGQHLIKYLQELNYHCIEPNTWLLEDFLNNNKVDKQFGYDNNSDFTLTVFNTKYDFILANSVFIHACKSQIEKCFSQINDVLSKKGKFIFNYIAHANDNESKEWTYPSHIYYSHSYIESLLEKHNLKYRIAKVKYPGKQVFVVAEKK